MSNSLTHTLPYPVKHARFSIPIAFNTSAGVPTDPTTPDTEISVDGGATSTDCVEEVTTGAGNGTGYITLTGAEMNNANVIVAAKSANCSTSRVFITPRDFPILGTGTLSAGSAGGGTLGTILSYSLVGCVIRTTGGTGGGGTGGANNQAREIATYNTSTGAFTVLTNWETTPDSSTTYDLLLTPLAHVAIASNVKWFGDIAQTGRDIGAGVNVNDFFAQAVSGTAQTGSTSTTLKLASGSSATDDYFKGRAVFITGGTGSGQGARMITGYVGSTKVATVDVAWTTTPDNTTTYAIIPFAVPSAEVIADTFLDRDPSAGPDTHPRSPRNALRVLRNKVTTAGGTLSVCKEDDTTEAWNAALTTNSSAEPITGFDPST